MRRDNLHCHAADFSISNLKSQISDLGLHRFAGFLANDGIFLLIGGYASQFGSRRLATEFDQAKHRGPADAAGEKAGFVADHFNQLGDRSWIGQRGQCADGFGAWIGDRITHGFQQGFDSRDDLSAAPRLTAAAERTTLWK